MEMESGARFLAFSIYIYDTCTFQLILNELYMYI